MKSDFYGIVFFLAIASCATFHKNERAGTGLCMPCGNDSQGNNLVCCRIKETRTIIEIIFVSEDSDEEEEETDDGIGPFLSWPECGNSTGSITKVVNGNDAKLGQFPWMVTLLYRQDDKLRLVCGGSLITYKHVLTAAHCVSVDLASRHMARVGDLDLENNDDNAQPVDVPIARIVIQEEYINSTLANDIAVLTLERNTKGLPGVIPICLPWKPEQRNERLEQLNLYVAGWGSEHPLGPQVPKLQFTSVKVEENSRCNIILPHMNKDKIICAGGGSTDSCTGDSGGPLMHGKIIPGKHGIHYELVGIVSYGDGCGKEGSPGVYTRVTDFLTWIDKHIDN